MLATDRERLQSGKFLPEALLPCSGYTPSDPDTRFGIPIAVLIYCRVRSLLRFCELVTKPL